MEDIKRIDPEVSDLLDEMVRLRRDFHRHPELGLQEWRTSGVIVEYLRGLGLEVRQGIGNTGVVGLLKGDRPGRTLMLRADMDGLPVEEKNDVPYKSVNEGVMHACGHDGHMAILLGTAAVLSRLRRHIAGQVKLVFQPAEESFGGALTLIREGVLEDPNVDAAFGLHLITALPVGTIGWARGIMMAAMDTYTLKVQGKGGHSAMPDGSIDAVLAGARAVQELMKLTVRDQDPLKAALINVGTIHGGTAVNVVAEEVELTGTVRTLDREVRASFPAAMMGAVSGIAQDMKAAFDLEYEQGYPPVKNDPGMTDLLLSVLRETPWKDSLIEVPPVMGSEDMAFYLEKVAGSFFFLGAGNPEKGLTSPLHSPEFDFDESALAIGATIFCRLALTYLA